MRKTGSGAVSSSPAGPRRPASLAAPIRLGLALVAAAVAVGSPGVAVPAALGAERTHVVISGPAPDWHPTPGFVLEIGDEEWLVRGSIGVRAVVELPTRVVIRDLRDCREAYSFMARADGPGAGYMVTVDQAGAFDVERGRGFSEGPYVPSSPVAACHLPDTSTVSGAVSLPVSIGTLVAIVRNPLIDLFPWR